MLRNPRAQITSSAVSTTSACSGKDSWCGAVMGTASTRETRDADHQAVSSPSFQALTTFSFPNSLCGKKARPEIEEHAHSVPVLPIHHLSFQEVLLKTLVFGQQESCASLVHQTRAASLARDTAVTSAGDTLSYAAFVEINLKITLSAT